MTNNPQTPWGWPDLSSLSLQSWAERNAGWLLIGALVVLAFATKERK